MTTGSSSSTAEAAIAAQASESVLRDLCQTEAFHKLDSVAQQRVIDEWCAHRTATLRLAMQADAARAAARNRKRRTAAAGTKTGTQSRHAGDVKSETQTTQEHKPSARMRKRWRPPTVVDYKEDDDYEE